MQLLVQELQSLYLAQKYQDMADTVLHAADMLLQEEDLLLEGADASSEEEEASGVMSGEELKSMPQLSRAVSTMHTKVGMSVLDGIPEESILKRKAGVLTEDISSKDAEPMETQ